ncbi:MAG: hypothetical protein AB7L65_07335 [Hyphomonadaceae bacterium]
MADRLSSLGVSKPEHPVEISATKAKQGLRGAHVFVILAVSTLAAGVALGAFWILFAAA